MIFPGPACERVLLHSSFHSTMAPFAPSSSKSSGASQKKPKFAMKAARTADPEADAPRRAKRARLAPEPVVSRTAARPAAAAVAGATSKPLKSALKKGDPVAKTKGKGKARDERARVAPAAALESAKASKPPRPLKPAKAAKPMAAPAPPPPLPAAFKIVAGSYEKLLYGLQGSVAVGPDGTLAFALKPVFIFPAHVSCVKAVAASPAGGKWLATGSADEIIKVWDLRRRKEVGGLMHHSGPSPFPTHSCPALNVALDADLGTRLNHPSHMGQ
jgi:hypothetical protein